MFVAVSSMSFLLPPTAYPARCGLLVTTLLVGHPSFYHLQFCCSRFWWTCSTQPSPPHHRTQQGWQPLQFGFSAVSSLSSSPSSSILSSWSTWRGPAWRYLRRKRVYMNNRPSTPKSFLILTLSFLWSIFLPLLSSQQLIFSNSAPKLFYVDILIKG